MVIRGVDVKEEIGNVYGSLSVISFAGSTGQGASWLCECACGNEVVMLGKKLRQGKQKHCGCKTVVGLFNALKVTGRPPCDRGCEFRERCQVEHLACRLFYLWFDGGGVVQPNPVRHPPNEEIYAKIYGKEK